MKNYLQILAFVIIGIVLLWFGFMLFRWIRLNWRRTQRGREKRLVRESGVPGDPQVCPVCSALLNKGELVKSQAFPSLTAGSDRLMHIRGCVYCLGGERKRLCPVCGASLSDSDILIARMFERSSRRKHVHVLGCSVCRKC